MVMVKLPPSITKLSPITIFLPEMFLMYMMLPEELASTMPNDTTVGQLLPVQGPIITLALVVIEALAGFENVASTLAYPLPVSSVPEVLTVGAVEYKAAYTLPGEVYD